MVSIISDTALSSLLTIASSACGKCFESDRKLQDAQSGRSFDVNINVCKSCKDKGKGCFFHGQSSLIVLPDLKQAFSALKNCPRYNVDRIPYLVCDNCSRDLRDDSLYLRKFISPAQLNSLTKTHHQTAVHVTRITIFVFSAGEKQELHVSTGTMICTSSLNVLQAWKCRLERFHKWIERVM